MTIYAFDVDHTLQVSGGPVPLEALAWLVRAGHVVGLSGNWAAVTLGVTNWQTIGLSFLGPMGDPGGKPQQLEQIKRYIRADAYWMVGNDRARWPEDVRATISDDAGAAAAAGWGFMAEHDFARGYAGGWLPESAAISVARIRAGR